MATTNLDMMAAQGWKNNVFYPVVMQNELLNRWWTHGQINSIYVERNFIKAEVVFRFGFSCGATHDIVISDDRWLDGDVRLKDDELAILYMYIQEGTL